MNVIVWHERCSLSNNWEGIFVSCGMFIIRVTSKDGQNEGCSFLLRSFLDRRNAALHLESFRKTIQKAKEMLC